MKNIIQIAANELAQKEISGPEHNLTIVNYAKEAGFTWVNDDETAWCSIFMNWVALKAGLKRSKKADARSWLKIGTKSDGSPEPGDVVVFWRESPQSWKGHVGIFFGYSANLKNVFTLGGNQGNSVSIASYPANMVLGFRRLGPQTIAALADKELRFGDTGQEVRALQEALSVAGFACGKIDGDFGIKTEAAVRALQAKSTHLNIDGIFGKNTRNYLITLLNQ
ncbi:MAG: TIGR02594 family protein [Bacteroidales bacterium]|nr:TIGR02594 family protein [Bacteroidales bacterium]